MIDPKIVDKIRKLLSLGANNPEGNEAAAALRKAAELAELYGLALSDVDRETGETVVEETELNCLHDRYSVWMRPLSTFMANIFNCRVIIQTRRFSDPGKFFIFIGTPTDIKLAVWYFKLIRLKIIRQSKAKFHLVADQKTYGYGAICTLQERLETMFVKKQEEIRTSDVRALVVVKNAEVDKAVDIRFPNLKKTKNKANLSGSSDAFAEGQKDGRTMGLHSGEINGNERKEIS